MQHSPQFNPDDKSIKWLKILVMTMTVTLIVGFIIIVGLFIAKFNSLTVPAKQEFPSQIVLPDGVVAETFTISKDWYSIITTDNKILVYDRETDSLIHSINLLSE